MYGVDINLAIIFATSLVALIVLGVFVLIGMKIAKSGKSKKARVSADEEIRLIQEIYQGLTKMEQRVEALETILFDRERERKRHEA
jgi:phage shock protein B